jgi:hypothetical protein
MTDNLQERNEQVINNIKSLQLMEMELYNSLENQKLTTDEKKQMIDRINQISQMRINMYANLNNSYANYQQNVSASRNTLNDQMVSIDVIENELKNSKRRLNLLQQEKTNKVRLVGINTYYGKKYNAHKEIMKTVVFICIPVLLLTFLANRGILSQQLNFFISGIVIIIGVILIGTQILDISNRDNMNFDEYNWHFDKNNIKTNSNYVNTNQNPWSNFDITCMGAECCDENNTYDSEQNKCIPNEICNASQNTSKNESFISGVLSEYADFPEKRLHNQNIKGYNYRF